MGTERDTLRASFGAALRAVRLAAGLTQQRLAALAEVDRRTVQRCEYGERRPRSDLIRLLALVIEHADPDTLEAELVAVAGDSIRAGWAGRGGRRRTLIERIERTGETRVENRERGRRRLAEMAVNKSEWKRW